MLDEPTEPAPIELPYTLRLQCEAAQRKFNTFAEVYLKGECEIIRQEIQKSANERLVELSELNVFYWKEMLAAESKVRTIREMVIAAKEIGLTNTLAERVLEIIDGVPEPVDA